LKIESKEISFVDPKKLIPYDKNMNKHTDEQIDKLIELIEYQGFRDPLIVQKGTNIIGAGHGRWAAAKKMGLKEVPVTYQEFENEAQFYAFVVSHNAINSNNWGGGLDLSQINTDIIDFGPELDVEMLGIKDFKVDIAEKIDPLTDEDEVPEVVHPITRKGDIWLLGNHRLMCGDSTMIDDVERLMGGEKADMVFTDPPYGVDYEGGALNKREKLANDDSNDIYDSVLPVLFAFTSEKAPFYIWHAAGYADMASKLGENDFKIRSQIIWNKNQAQFGALSAQYKQKHEPCFYCHKKGAAPFWYGPTNEVTVWVVNREKKNEFHPTQKPIELIERALTNSSMEKTIVLDLFGGSGSTLIACQKLNRVNRSMEIDEKYCDVIIKRWQNYTGKKATLESTNQTYEELKVERDGQTT
jgi:DNA modification methylase